jgi:sensor histidine kinase regulating citrate/malate metabolism
MKDNETTVSMPIWKYESILKSNNELDSKLEILNSREELVMTSAYNYSNEGCDYYVVKRRDEEIKTLIARLDESERSIKSERHKHWNEVNALIESHKSISSQIFVAGKSKNRVKHFFNTLDPLPTIAGTLFFLSIIFCLSSQMFKLETLAAIGVVSFFLSFVLMCIDLGNNRGV